MKFHLHTSVITHFDIFLISSRYVYLTSVRESMQIGHVKCLKEISHIVGSRFITSDYGIMDKTSSKGQLYEKNPFTFHNRWYAIPITYHNHWYVVS
jgi:hypothetical protein